MYLSYDDRDKCSTPGGDYPNLNNRGGVMGILSTTPTNTKNFSKKNQKKISSIVNKFSIYIFGHIISFTYLCTS